MATKFSPCKGSYVLNQFPSNVMFGMNGFHVSISQWSDTGPSWPSCLKLGLSGEELCQEYKCWGSQGGWRGYEIQASNSPMQYRAVYAPFGNGF